MFRRSGYVPRGITASGLFAIERRFWELAVASIHETGSVPETLVLIATDDSWSTNVGGGRKLADGASTLRGLVISGGADAALYYGYNASASRLSLYTYWHSASGRRIRIADAAAADGVITLTERDMSRATGLSSWVEDLF